MRLEWAVLIGAALIAAAIALTGRWGISTTTNGMVRIDHWTGEVTVCGADVAEGETPEGVYRAKCAITANKHN